MRKREKIAIGFGALLLWGLVFGDNETTGSKSATSHPTTSPAALTTDKESRPAILAETTSLPAEPDLIQIEDDPEDTSLPTAKVIGIYDGDTVTLLQPGNTQLKVRLDGIDAPEIGQDFGNKAKKALSAIIGRRDVSYTEHGTDKYGRTIATLFIDDLDVCEELVHQGFAWHFKKYSNSEKLAEAELEARQDKRGLWAQHEPMAPWDWRALGREAAAARKAQQALPKEALPTKETQVAAVKEYWLNSNSNTRHNRFCRWFKRTKRGYMCLGTDGDPCGKCGG